jgi:auxin efflux carrier family protein
MDYLGGSTPTAFRLARSDVAGPAYDQGPRMPFMVFNKPHDSHPALGHLILLVFEAVMEVVCVSLPGYIVARLGHFDADKQKFLANLNVMLFTPCLSMRACFNRFLLATDQKQSLRS